MIAGSIGWDWQLDGWIVVAGTLCAVAAALLGNFLVLRRMSMLGDAVTHAVLPGIAAAFFISNSRSSLPMFVGAIVVGVLTALFTEWIRRFGRVDEGASMGVVFTTLFALGLVMLVQAADRVDLDPDCVLYGSIELTPLQTIDVFDRELPRAVAVLLPVAIINALFVTLFFKELRISSFDPSLASAMGISATLMHYALMVMVSVTAVASFESVGSILVVAMFVVPPAAAYMLTDRLGVMIGISALVATASAVGGHISALVVPHWFGYGSTTTAGMMAVVAGLLFLLAASFGPRHGVIVRWLRHQWLSLRILCDDVVALLYRREERELRTPTQEEVADDLLAGRWSMVAALRILRGRGELVTGNALRLTDAGRDRGRQLVRSHRLWEQYLVSEADAESDRIHDKAERFEHFTDRALRDRLDRATETPDQDPHGSPIPQEDSR